jgi:CDP-glycerol glycerophosphotransferase
MRHTHGPLLTFSKKIAKYLTAHEQYRDINVYCAKDRGKLVEYVYDNQIRVIIHPGFSIHHFKNVEKVRHVQIFHGTSDKPFNFHKSLDQYDLILVPGKKMMRDIVQRELASQRKIIPIGYPKIDAFLHSNFDNAAYKKKEGMDEHKKTVLYSPTWNDPDQYSSFSKFIGVILTNLGDFNVIVKPHTNTLRYRPWQILRAYVVKGKNCFIYPNSPDILPFMSISDIMLTDISSVSYEYIPFGKPLVFLCPKPIDSIPPEHRWIWHCGDVVTDRRELHSTIVKNIQIPDLYNEKRRKVLDQSFLDFDGKSPERFEKAVRKLLMEEES